MEGNRTMEQGTSRRGFMKQTLGLSAVAALGARVAATQEGVVTESAAAMPRGNIAGMSVSRLLLGGNLLTHFTHSRDLMYVYDLAAHYNTHEKILDTLDLAVRNGVNTTVIHTVPSVDRIVRHHRERGGGMQWIICPTAAPDAQWDAYVQQVEGLVENGIEAIYVWGVSADRLVKEEKYDAIVKAVELVKGHGLPSGVGGHDLRVIKECEARGVPADFYIKTYHHHHYPTAPRPEELTDPIREIPGYWCRDPEDTIEAMKGVEKPWIAFKVMAAGAIPPKEAFAHAFENGADHVLAGMFDFEIEEDAALIREALLGVQRTRPWRS